MFFIVVIVFILNVVCCEDMKFPPDFKFGVATASYQVEGAWNVSDKGENMWDKLLHSYPNTTADHSNGDTTNDMYHLWRQDLQLLTDLGVKYYRFSISWTRILPSGYTNKVSTEGAKYYSDLIDALLAKGIQPVVTIYHFDLPQSLQDLGGWTNPLIVNWFADYARVIYSLYADRVKIWITINEPFIICDGGYFMVSAPNILSPVGVALCNKYVLLAHAKAWRIYDEEYKPKYHGIMSIATLFFWFEPATENDIGLTELVIQHWAGRYTHAIFSKTGGWPPELEKAMNEFAAKNGVPSPLLPFSEEEIKLMRGTYDYFALNHYTTRRVRPPRPGEVLSKPVVAIPELNAVFDNSPNWVVTPIFDWFAVYPKGLRSQLSWLKNNYDNIPVLITENGYPSGNDTLEDDDRVDYFRGYLKEVLLSINEDDVNVTGYIAWSFMDNFEWFMGYQIKYGLYYVNFTDPNLRRIPRKSALYYADVIKKHSLDVE